MRAKPTLLAGLLSAYLLTGCATAIPEIADSSCKSFKPISSSKADTEPTKRQIIAHNKVFDTICPEPKGAPAKVASAGHG